jgi:hypothetical protein
VENMGAVTDMMKFGVWGNYIIWILLYAAMIVACAIGLGKSKYPAFIFLLISVCLSLLHHLPSIFMTLKTLYNPGSLTGIKTMELISGYYVASGFLSLLAAIFMVIGLFMLAAQYGKPGPA